MPWPYAAFSELGQLLVGRRPEKTERKRVRDRNRAAKRTAAYAAV